MQYSAISSDGTTITIKTGGRAASNTTAVAHAQGTVVECYNLDGIPLTEINKTHTQISAPTLDSYDLITNSVGINGITGGSTGIYATQNVPFEVITPQIQTAIVPKTSIAARLNAVTGTSINDGVTALTNSFVNDGTLFDVELNTTNYLDKQYLVASKVNENARNNGSKSLLIQAIMQSESEYLSPVIDLDRLSCITTSNRINNLTTDSTATLAVGDPNAAIYITRLARLTIQSKSLKVMFDAWLNFINPQYNYNFRYKGDYATTITINQYNSQNEIIYSVNLYDAYAVSMNQLDLNWSDDGYHKLVVTFAYTYWQNNSLQALGMELVDAGINAVNNIVGGLGGNAIGGATTGINNVLNDVSSFR